MKEANYNFDELIHSGSFRRWVEGSASHQEKSYWDEWVTSDPENRALALRAQQKIVGLTIQPSSQPDQHEAWDRLQYKIRAEGDRAYNYDIDTSGRSRNTGLQWIYRIAAVFLLAGLTGLAVSFMGEDQTDHVSTDQLVRKEVATDYGERKTISLSDGSEIMLNAHSSLVYTIDRSDSNAIEVLLEGEAFFSVATRKKPTSAAFRVKTSSGLVKVMGTQFVVSTRNRNTQVVLEEGKVALNPSNQERVTILKPGQLAEFNASSDSVYTEFVNPEVYTSWRTSMLVFDSTPFRDVIARLENTYGVKVVVREPDLYERELSGSIDNTNLEVIADALSNTLDTPVGVSEEIVYIGREN